MDLLGNLEMEISSLDVPSEISFFSSKHVQVEEIACGIRLTLALVNDKTLLNSEFNYTDKRVYGFGSNRHRQVGNISSRTQKSCKFPEVADGFENYIVSCLCKWRS